MSTPDRQPSRQEVLNDTVGEPLHPGPLLLERLDLSPCIRIGTAYLGRIPGHSQASALLTDRLAWISRRVFAGAHYRGPEDFSFSLS